MDSEKSINSIEMYEKICYLEIYSRIFFFHQFVNIFFGIIIMQNKFSWYL